MARCLSYLGGAGFPLVCRSESSSEDPSDSDLGGGHMNLAQMRVAARDILTAGSGRNTTVNPDTFWSDDELNYYINKCQRDVFNYVRRARADYFTRILRTTDPALVILGQSFSPSSLAWSAGTGNYQLPPDFVRMKLITDLSEDKIHIRAGDISSNAFRLLMNQNAGNTAREYLYDILGVRTLVLRPIPQEIRNLEFVYEKLLPKLRDWTTGTVTINSGSTQAVFSSSADISNRLVVGDELIVGTTSAVPTLPDPNVDYPVIKSIDDAVTVTLAGPFLDASVMTVGFRASAVSEIPKHHHDILIEGCVKEAFKKGTNPHTDSAALHQTEFDRILASLVADVEIRQGSDPEFVDAYLEDIYND
jgi:hypothetical protein